MDEITVHQLIVHTSGLRDWVQALAVGGWRAGDILTTRDVLRVLERQEDLNFEPGSGFLYSNSGYVALASLVEQVTSRSSPEWSRGRLFVPLGMSDTRFIDAPSTVVP